MVGSCPNCGAWVAGDECEYCGTRFAEKPKIIVSCKFGSKPEISNGFAWGEVKGVKAFDSNGNLVAIYR